MNLRTGKWEAMPQYGSFVLDNLDSWCCALSYECDSRCPEPRS
jgi:heterodisulfide reductase subunit C